MKNKNHITKPNQLPKYRMEKEWLNSSSCETDLGFQLTTNCQEIYPKRVAAKKAKATLCFLTGSRSRMKKAATLLFSALWGPGIRSWDHTIQRILTNMAMREQPGLQKGLETKLHKDHLKALG